MTSLCETTKSISTETHLIRRQLAAEMKKSGGGGGRGSVARKLTDRARALENGLEVLTGKKSKLDTHMTEFFNA